jgi:hypothetical protein
MATVLNILLDLLLAGSLLLFGYGLIQMVVHESSRKERLLLSMALVAGAVVALGAQATGVGFATYTVDALTGARPGGAVVKTFSVLIPGGMAAGFGWYFLRIMQRSAAKGLRLMCFLGMLTVVGFAEIYAQATNTKGVVLGAAAIPNSSFVAGMILSLLVLAPEENVAAQASAGRLDALAALFKRKASHRHATRQPAQDASWKIWESGRDATGTHSRVDAGDLQPRNLFADD